MKEIGINKITTIIKDQTKKNGIIHIADMEIEVKRTLTVREHMSFVRDVINFCIMSDDGPELLMSLFHFGLRANILHYFAGFKIDVPAEKLFALCYDTDIYDRVCEQISPEYLADLIAEVESQLDYETQMLLKATKFEALCDELIELVRKGAENIGAADKILEFVEKLGAVNEVDVAQAIQKIRGDSNGVES